MKFIVYEHGEPIVGQTVEEHWWIHRRTLGTFAEFDEKFGHREGAWTSKGRNHRENDKTWRGDRPCVYREDLRAVPVIEFETLDTLAEFLLDSGRVVRISGYADVPLEIGDERDC
jgi:hypothetical protein